MNAIRSMISMDTYRIPLRLRLVLSRFGSLILLFQRSPVVQFLFPEANIMGGASMANSFGLAVTTVVGLGAFDSVAGATSIDEVQPLAVTGPTTNRDTTVNGINVSATVSAPLNFEFKCDSAPSDPESWQIVTSSGVATTLPTGLAMTYTATTPSDGAGGFLQNNLITGTPFQAGIYPVYVRVYKSPNYTSKNVTQLFNLCVLGLSTQPAATPATISSGQTSSLTCTAAGFPIPTTWHAATAAVTYQWYQGLTGAGTAITGATGTLTQAAPTASYTTPALSSSSNYWVKIKSVLSGNTVEANSNTVVVNVSTPPTVTVASTGTSTSGSPINFTLSFSQSVTGLTTGGITVTNGTMGTLSGSGAYYTLPVTPTAQGAVTCQVNAGVANGNTASNTASVIYDSVAPTVIVAPTGTSTTSSPITFTLSFSESVTGLVVGNITVTNGTMGTLSGSGASYTLPVTPTGQGAVTCTVHAGAVTDAATNPNPVSNTASVTYDTAYSSWESVLAVGKRGPTQIPQNDGITNLMKFACNLDPTKPDVRRLTAGGSEKEGLPCGSLAGGKLHMEFLRRKWVSATNPGISYTLQFSSDLGATPWTEVDVTTTPPGASIDSTWERVVVDDSLGGAIRVGRLKVVQSP